MTDLNRIRENVERILHEVVEKHSLAICETAQQRLLEHLGSELTVTPGAGPTDLLNAAVASVQDASSQTDILKALLEGATKFAERSGLLVVRGTTATGWQARGLDDNDNFRLFTTDCSKGLAQRVLRDRVPAAAAADEFDSAFVNRYGPPADGNILLLPLVIKEKVAALIYADGGDKGSAGLDPSAMELLVRSTGLWLEVLSYRKMAPAENHTAQEAPPVPSPQTPISTPASAMAAASHGNGARSEDEVHNRARRFAKLLVEEIKLYNQAKVNDGRATRDLYDRLKDDIDKSRATYDKRYGQAVTDIDYFTQELVRILADNDRSALGANFHG